MNSWTFYFTALPLGIAVILLAFAVASALTQEKAAIFAGTVSVAMAVGYTIGRLEGK